MSAFSTAAYAPNAFDTDGQGVEIWTPVGEVARALPITLTVIATPIYRAPPASGGIDPNPGAGLTGRLAAVWTPIVTLGGAEVTARCFGAVEVMAREGAARIAEFTLRPQPGEAVSLAAWVGLPVTIDVAKVNTDGSVGAARRLFTGVVDTPAVNLAERMIAISATDDLQGVLDAMSDADVDALVGGRWSPVIFDEAKSHGWQRAEDRLSTRAASLDLSPFRIPRVSEWAQDASLRLAAGDIEDGSLAVSIASRAALVNQVDVRFDYRYPRLKIEGYGVSFTATQNWYMDIGVNGRQILTRQAVESALSSAGATVQGNIAWNPVPESFAQPGTDYVWVKPPEAVASQLCRGFSALCTFDYAKYNEEAHLITVKNDASIAQVGIRASQMQSSLEGQYQEPTTYEANTFMVKSETNKALKPANTLTARLGVTHAENPTLSPETNRSAANLAMETLIDIAKTTIAASHRNSAVTLVTPVNPDIDLNLVVGVETEILTAEGKVSALSHRLDADTGRAVTEVTLAISSLMGVGIDHPETPTVPPEEAAPTDTKLQVNPICRFNSGIDEDHMFSVEFPGVEEAERAKTTIEIRSDYAAPVIENLFLLEF